MQVKFSVYFCSDEGERFFGAGPCELLLEVERLGSLRAAAQHLGMAYTKAFSMIKRAEKEFGFAMTQRTIGGKGGGGSTITPQAKELLMRYQAYRTACGQSAQDLYNTYFSSFHPEKDLSPEQ
ncbi:winged helix-turn-helix domain-containing protein [Allofournierella sp. CML151]|uniref:winged helix-turn-helix domain-containing protein n=1 Tax=Allofournierella sp. CML151 TaxID=2998082 RepID=UPI0022EB385F|nr:LysR family transcriptional regulator [Fournierella sp. CML151]